MAPSSASIRKGTSREKRGTGIRVADKTGKMTPAEVAKKGAEARWTPRFESDEATRSFFLACGDGEGLEALTEMRKQVDIASKAFEENMHGTAHQFCKTCERPVGDPPAVRWWKRDTVTDPVTRMTHNEFFCSQQCWLATTTQNGRASRVPSRPGQELQPANR